MKSLARGRRYPAVAAAFLVLPVPAARAAPVPVPVRFVYSAPSTSGERVTWHWTIHNAGDRAVARVVLTHKLSPKVRIASVSRPCRIVWGGAIRCEYGVLASDASRSGSLTAVIPRKLQGRVGIQGDATWRPVGGIGLRKDAGTTLGRADPVRLL